MARQGNKGIVKTDLTCVHCNKTFTSNAWFEKHSCIYKKRWEARDSRVFQIAYDTWLSLIASMKPCPYKDKTIYKFIRSVYFNPCLLLANQIIMHNIPNHKKMIWWICNYQKYPMNEWGKDKVYEAYKEYRMHNESIEHAVVRSINSMKKVCDERFVPIKDFFSLSPNLISGMLSDGRLSGWMLFICETSYKYTSNVNDDHKRLIYNAMKPEIWNKKKVIFSKEIQTYKEKLKKVGL